MKSATAHQSFAVSHNLLAEKTSMFLYFMLNRKQLFLSTYG